MQLSFEELFKYDLQKLYNLEMQLVDGLKMLAAQAESSELKQGLLEHLEQTKTHVARIMQICDRRGWSPMGMPSKTVKAMQVETLETLNGAEKGPVSDAIILGAGRKAEHFEIAAYASIISLAEQLGDSESVTLLQQTLEEEKSAEEKLASLASKRQEAQLI